MAGLEPSPIKEVGFGLDNYDEPLVLDDKKSIEQIFRNIFTTRPGTYPSQPEIGIDIREYLYLKNPDMEELKRKIYRNSQGLFDYVDFSQIIAQDITNNRGEKVIVIILPITIDHKLYAMTMGISNGPDNDIIFQFQMKMEEKIGGNING